MASTVYETEICGGGIVGVMAPSKVDTVKHHL